MTRFRVTIRGEGVELRGYVDNYLPGIARVIEPYGVVVASPAPDDYDPFAISEPEYPPTYEGSFDVISGLLEDAPDAPEFLSRVAYLHLAQANVIRGERYLREQAEAELRDRELHHFETEQMIAGAAGIADSLEKNWEQGDLAGAVNEAIGYLRGMAVS